MTQVDTADYAEFVLEVEFTPESGTYSKICGVTGVNVTRAANVTTTEVPDCDDETKPHGVARNVRSIEVSVSATGLWALSSDSKLKEWFYSGKSLSARIRNAKVEVAGAVGAIYVETAPCILAGLNNERPADKGAITASIELQFSGTPARDVKAA